MGTNIHVAHIDSTVCRECPFCQQEESINHLSLKCGRLKGPYELIKGRCRDCKEALTCVLIECVFFE